jgi:CYTH domain-containing protein
MASEIELKFRTTTYGWKNHAGQPKEIKQHYLPSETTLTLNGDKVTITAPGCAPVVIPVSDLPPNSKNGSFVDAFEALDTTITVGGKTELRVRSKNEELTITLKQDTKDSNTRDEFESYLNNAEAFKLLSGQSQGRMVGKKRYKLDKDTLFEDGIISPEMYNAVGEIIVDEYDKDHHAYLRDNGVPEAVLEIEFKEGTSEDDVERFKTEFSKKAGFAIPITPQQKEALKNKNIAADAAADAAVAVAEVAGILGGEATQG